MILVSPIPIVISADAVVITNVVVGMTPVTPMIGITLLIVITIVMCVLGCARVVSRTRIVAMISIGIWQLTGNSPSEIVSSGRITFISRVVSLILTLITIVVSMVVIARSWRWRMGWVVHMSKIGLSAAVIYILVLTTVHSIASIVVAWCASKARLILIIVVVRVAVIVTITTGVHGPPGRVKL